MLISRRAHFTEDFMIVSIDLEKREITKKNTHITEIGLVAMHFNAHTRATVGLMTRHDMLHKLPQSIDVHHIIIDEYREEAHKSDWFLGDKYNQAGNCIYQKNGRQLQTDYVKKANVRNHLQDLLQKWKATCPNVLMLGHAL